MAYYFTVQTKKGEYLPLDITKSKYFTRNSNLKGTGMTLQEIDLFTMMFYDEKELRRALFKEGLLEMRYTSNPLSARIIKNKKYHKVMYDFLYQKDMEYVIDPNKIIERINNKLLEDDYRFILQYANNYLNFYDCGSTAPEVREFASYSIKTGRRSNLFNMLDENHDNPLVRMTKLLIYEYYQASNGRIEYKDKIKYRNLHSVIAFVNNYDKKYNVNIIEDTINHSQSKEKKKLKKDSIDGQINLFDE